MGKLIWLLFLYRVSIYCTILRFVASRLDIFFLADVITFGFPKLQA